jgi:hypothetical protein
VSFVLREILQKLRLRYLEKFCWSSEYLEKSFSHWAANNTWMTV